LQDIHSILLDYWGYKTFRPQQEEIINSILEGKDTLALLPTGGGKSICYQVPSLSQKGICLVVSPLIALMKDQVENLKKKGIGALAIYSGMSKKDILRTFENAREDYFKFLYVSPERLETSLFREYLPALDVNLIAVDEAHCISQWGYDFRPSYLRIAALREELPDVPILAVTASATKKVQDDICEKLLFSKKNIFRQSFERKNLSYSAFQVDSKINKLLEITRKIKGSGIVYCKTRKRTQEITNLLQLHQLNATNYHAGLSSEERVKRQQDWIGNKVDVIVCTNAFGMGIDKPDVRFVVHVDVPDSLESYYQEAGRCGRDGQKAYAVLLFNENDLKDLSGLHLVRYPSMDTIRQVYEALVNYLQILVNSGQDIAYTFRFEQFARNFKLDVSIAINSLKALEQDGWIEYNEKNYIPSTVVFTASKSSLYEFYKNHSEFESLCTTLLRTYDGIFDFQAFISENLLARLQNSTEADIKRELLRISAFGIIDYSPQDDAPKLYFRKNRVAVKDLRINLDDYNNRKEAFIKRVEKIIRYTETQHCRSGFIDEYFNENEPVKCGICDNCLKEKKESLSTSNFLNIETQIRLQLSSETLTLSQLLERLNTIKKQDAIEVINFLQEENALTVNSLGRICLNNHKLR
jgi:ATP-dependent DNA helicase RecQ